MSTSGNTGAAGGAGVVTTADTPSLATRFGLGRAVTGTGFGGAAAWVTPVLDFWFGELDRKAWFTRSEHLDAEIQQRFAPVLEVVASDRPAWHVARAERALAAVIVLDQFPRNMFRGSARAFATDAAARRVASHAVEAGLDLGLTADQRLFLYLPFEHSEDIIDQDRAVALIAALGDEAYTRYAQAHRDIVARFGRFPHRNAVLGRASTPEETVFLTQPGSSF